MRRLIAIMALLVLPFIANAQIKDSVDVSYKARGTHIYQDGRKMSDQEVKDIVISRIGNAETRYQEYLKAQKDFRAGILNMGGGFALAGVFTWLQVKAFEVGKETGCVSPGGFPFILGGIAWAGFGIAKTVSAYGKVNALAKDISLSGDHQVTVTPQVSQNGVGLRFNF